MANERFSQAHNEVAPEKLPAAASRFLQALQGALHSHEIRVFDLDAGLGLLVFVCELHINLPTRGPVGGIDIRPIEPVCLLINVNEYPYLAPLVFSDRLDFPKSVPHINPGMSTKAPAWFCLYRGNLNDWYAEQNFDVKVLLTRIRQWLSDAASNRLQQTSQEFESTRIDQAIGLAVYDPDLFTETIKQGWRRRGRSANGYGFLSGNLLGQDYAIPHAKSRPINLRLSPENNADVLRKQRWLFQQQQRMPSDIDRVYSAGLFGLYLSPPKEFVYAEHIAHLPRDEPTFETFCKELHLPIRTAIRDLFDKQLVSVIQDIALIPVVVAIQRPSNLVGWSSNIELIPFLIGMHQKTNEVYVDVLQHHLPLTIELAETLSRWTSVDARSAILGCGALGSKLALHLARSGYTQLTLIDPDNIQPHNMVRFALTSESVAKSKADALRDAIVGFYPEDREAHKVIAVKASAAQWLNQRQRRNNAPSLIVDATASSSVHRLLAHSNSAVRCTQFELADEGRLGIGLFEGIDRNPRLDDLQVELHATALNNSVVQAWLNRHLQQAMRSIQAGFEEIPLGMSCSSVTTTMADDLVSLHAANLSRELRAILTDNAPVDETGLIVLSSTWLEEDPTRESGSIRLIIPSVTVVKSANGGDWEIRISSSACHNIAARLESSGSTETGGLLFGSIDPSSNTIYVVREFPPSPDSHGWPYEFRFGIEGAFDELQHIEQTTGGQLTYVGEWHSHPNGLETLSQKDNRAVAQLRALLDPANLPTHVMIVTPDKFLPYVFTP